MRRRLFFFLACKKSGTMGSREVGTKGAWTFSQGRNYEPTCPEFENRKKFAETQMNGREGSIQFIPTGQAVETTEVVSQLDPRFPKVSSGM